MPHWSVISSFFTFFTYLHIFSFIYLLKHDVETRNRPQLAEKIIILKQLLRQNTFKRLICLAQLNLKFIAVLVSFLWDFRVWLPNLEYHRESQDDFLATLL